MHFDEAPSSPARHYPSALPSICPYMPLKARLGRPGTGALGRKPEPLKAPGYLRAQPAYATLLY